MPSSPDSLCDALTTAVRSSAVSTSVICAVALLGKATTSPPFSIKPALCVGRAGAMQVVFDGRESSPNSTELPPPEAVGHHRHPASPIPASLPQPDSATSSDAAHTQDRPRMSRR